MLTCFGSDVEFNVIDEVDENGRKVDVDINTYANGGLAKPNVFKARIVLRNERLEGENGRTVRLFGDLGDVDKEQMDALDKNIVRYILGTRDFTIACHEIYDSITAVPS